MKSINMRSVEGRIGLLLDLEKRVSALESKAVSATMEAAAGQTLEGIGLAPIVRLKLEGAGFSTPEQVRAASDSELLSIKGIGPGNLEHIRERVG